MTGKLRSNVYLFLILSQSFAQYSPESFYSWFVFGTNTEGGLFYIFDKCGGFGSTRYTICFDVYNFGESLNLHLKIYCQFIFNSCEVNVVKQNPMSPFKGGKI